MRGASAAAAALAFFGTTAFAPFSMTPAAATESAVDGTTAATAILSMQELTAAAADASIVDLPLSSVETRAGSGSGADVDGARRGTQLYTLEQFMFSGVVNWGGYRFTYYSQQVLPGGGLPIPGRHVNAGGYVSDADGYIVLAGSAPLGTVYATPFGYRGKIYDRGTSGNHLDVYIR